MLKNRKFQKNIEDFVCERCSFCVKGNGFTNHCPNCLWSKHVDINPGDRACECLGLMEPITISGKSTDHIITHRCVKCGLEKRNKVSEDDNFEEILKISSKKD